MTDQPRPEVLQHTATVVAAHVAHNMVEAEALPRLIQAVYRALSCLSTEPEPAAAPRTPAVPIRKSVFPDYIVCLEDGAKMTMLKRYLDKRYGLTPAAYRERWGLPADYPMAAPNYASKRSTLAKQAGLGRKKADGPPDNVAATLEGDTTEGEMAVTKVPARRARSSKG